MIAQRIGVWPADPYSRFGQVDTDVQVFLSYARADDEPFVTRLAAMLQARRHHVWFDRWHMPSRALTFMEEIRRAIDTSDRLVAILGPAAVASNYVRSEWQYALSRAKIVTPILRLGEYDTLPPELRDLHCPDCRSPRAEVAVFDEITRILSEPLPPTGEVFDLPSLPPHFQPRPNGLSAVSSAVLPDQHAPIVVGGWNRITLLFGMGGTGKSVLAAAFAQSTHSRRVFVDGTFWFDVRRDPEPAALADEIAGQLERHLGTAGAPTYDRGQPPRRHLQTLLRGKRCLIVLDNAATTEQVELLARALDASSRLLVTTRNADLLEGVNKVPVTGLATEEARDLLADWIGHLPLKQAAQPIIDKCEGLPFALALCGAMASVGITLEEIKAKLEAADIQFLEKRFPDYPYPTLLPCLAASLETLQSRSDAGAQRFKELAVFPPGAFVPRSVVDMFWKATAAVQPPDASKLLTLMRDLSILRLENDSIQLHQLMHDYLLILVPDVIRYHVVLLDSYAARTGPDLVRGPDDGYHHAHLAYHLIGAGRGDDLFMLLTSSPAWMQAKSGFRPGDGTFLTDVHLAIDSIEEPVCRSLLPTLARLFAARHIELRGPRSYGESILRALVSLGEKHRAMLLARGHADRLTRLMQLLVIHDELSARGEVEADLLEEAKLLCSTEPDDKRRSHMQQVLIEACVRRGDDLTYVQELWKEVQRIDNQHDHFTGSLLAMRLAQSGALEEATAIASKLPRAQKLLFELERTLDRSDYDLAYEYISMLEGTEQEIALSKMVSRLAGARHYRKAREIARRIQSEHSQIVSLSNIPSPECIAEAVALARKCVKVGDRMLGLMACARALRSLEAQQRKQKFIHRAYCSFRRLFMSQTVDDSTQIAREAELCLSSVDSRQRVLFLTFLLKDTLHWNSTRAEDLFEEVCAATRALESAREQSVHFAELAHLYAQKTNSDVERSRKLLAEAMNAAEADYDSQHAHAAIAELLPALVNGGRPELALSRALSLRDEHARTAALQRVARAGADAGRADVVDRVMAAAGKETGAFLRDKVNALAKYGRVEQAQALAAQLDPQERNAANATIGLAWAECGNDERVRATVEGFSENPDGRYWMLRLCCDVARLYGLAGGQQWLAMAETQLPFALAAYQSNALACLGRAYAELNPSMASSTFTSAIEAAWQVEDDTFARFLRGTPANLEVLRGVAEQLIAAGLLEQSLELTRALRERAGSEWRAVEASLLAKIAANFIRSGSRERGELLFQEAFAAARAAENMFLGRPWNILALYDVSHALVPLHRGFDGLKKARL